jgi:DNA-binding XRE family transcriptional regulator
LGLRQKDLAEIIGYDKTGVLNWEKGARFHPQISLRDEQAAIAHPWDFSMPLEVLRTTSFEIKVRN